MHPGGAWKCIFFFRRRWDLENWVSNVISKGRLSSASKMGLLGNSSAFQANLATDSFLDSCFFHLLGSLIEWVFWIGVAVNVDRICWKLWQTAGRPWTLGHTMATGLLSLHGSLGSQNHMTTQQAKHRPGNESCPPLSCFHTSWLWDFANPFSFLAPT